MAKPGAGAMITKLEAPATDHVALLTHNGEADGAGAGNDDAAVLAGKRADAGGEGIIVNDDRCKREPGLFDLFRRDRGDDAGQAKTRMQSSDGKTRLCSGFLRSGNDIADGSMEILIDIGRPADSFSEKLPRLVADARTAFRAAAINAQKKSPILRHTPLIPKEYHYGKPVLQTPNTL